MSTVTRTYLVDDLDGSEREVTKVCFQLDRQMFEIDLSPTSEARLRNKLAKFIDAATVVRPQGRRPVPRKQGKTAVTGREQTQAIRAWAAQNGFEVSERGRISAAVQEAFNAAH